MKKTLTERQRIEKEINELCMAQIGYRNGGLTGSYGVKVSAEEQARLTSWKVTLQARRRALMTAEEVAAEDSLPF